MNRMASCYKTGEGCEKNMQKAFHMCEQAAGLGYSASMCNLGILYEHGEGVAQNVYMAKEWYTKAAAQGHAGAQQILDHLR